MIDWPKLLGPLAKRRPVFHSEADFQHELAWEVRTRYAQENPKVRLEYPTTVGSIDLWISWGGKSAAIEIKYKKSKIRLQVDGEVFDFNSDGAHPFGRYDVFRDWVRVANAGADFGYTLFLTNDSIYWRAQATGASEVYSLHEGRKVVAGKHHWPATAEKFLRDRPHPIHLESGISIRWKRYSVVGPEHEFRYLLFSCRKPNRLLKSPQTPDANNSIPGSNSSTNHAVGSQK